ncbi:hypothetical protein ACH4VS_25800 [Streptomyces hygroscopicus]|uniref:hypothetical protein n=1 Tax=Streptomyces hygroscopicus TaxID=1912 RepID=UPI0008373929|nr:hypothetical protein [Streptomyces hygroscopicus]GLV76244.1 hypothetical protein Shyhy02_42440 [Streptomyces hygroscopicus subsp. hygroscopicus]
MDTRSPRALIVGKGIAGLATAMRLREAGWEPLLVERAARRRPAGYFVGLFETGRATAERMGVLDAIGNRFNPTSVTLRHRPDRPPSPQPGIRRPARPAPPAPASRDLPGSRVDEVHPSAEGRVLDSVDGDGEEMRSGTRDDHVIDHRKTAR